MASVAQAPERAVRWLDDRQQDRWWLALPIGVVRKYADDRGSAFAGLVTFQVFLGLLPLLVVALTVFGQLLVGSEELQEATLESTIAQLPIVGERLEDDVSTLGASGPVVVISILGLLWTAAGIYHSMQLAMNQVWNVEGIHRQGFVSRHLRALLLFVLVISAALLTAQLRGSRPPGVPGWLVHPITALGGALLGAVLLMAVLRLVTSPDVPTVHLVPAAVLAGLLWEVLQRFGTLIVGDRLSEAGDLYGTLGIVVVTLFWINLLARAVIISNEWAVVSWRRLYPRRIAQPPLTTADRRVLIALVRNERRRPEQHVWVTFDGDADEDPLRDHDGEGGGDPTAGHSDDSSDSDGNREGESDGDSSRSDGQVDEPRMRSGGQTQGQ